MSNVINESIGNIPTQFEQYPLVAGGAAVLAGGVVAANMLRSHYKQLEATANYPDPDMQESARRSVRTVRRAGAAGVLLAFSAGAGHLADMAQPYNEETVSNINSIAIVADAGTSAYANDVETPDGSVARIEAIANYVTRFDDIKGVKITFIAAGSNPQSVGSMENGAGRGDVVDSLQEYINDLSNTGTANMTEALKIAEAAEADKILVFGTVAGAESPLLQDQATRGERNISVVALGKEGTKVNAYDGEQAAAYDKKTSDKVVGTEDSYAASSVAELESVVGDIIDSQYTTTKRTDSKLFERMRDYSAAGLVGLVMTAGIAAARRRK